MLKSLVSWKGNMEFNVTLNGHNFTIDADESVGGMDKGPSPKPLLLSALGGCTGMDVISILKKMKVEVKKFDVEVSARSTDVHPKFYDKFIIKYLFEGENLPFNKLEKAINLSETRYCGVSFMFNKTSEITAEIYVNGEKVK